jgi:copper chaperone CopZ
MRWTIGLAAVCGLCLGCSSGNVPEAKPGAPPQVTKTAYQAGDSVTLRVPTMYCPRSCWPRVKETLEQQPGVAEVKLVPQAKEGEIDKPEVTVKLKGEFNVAQAVQSLAAAQFSDVTVVQQ